MEFTLFGHLVLSSVENAFAGEELCQTRLVNRGTIQKGLKFLPLPVVEDKQAAVAFVPIGCRRISFSAVMHDESLAVDAFLKSKIIGGHRAF
jgi:hypothetical protein